MKSHVFRRFVCVLAVGCASVAVMPSPVLAQNETVNRPTAPAPSKSSKGPSIRLALLLAILFAAGVGANTIPSKRGHQD